MNDNLIEANVAGRLMLLTDVDGVLDASGRLLSTIDAETARGMIEDEAIAGGMIPKMNCALDALEAGVEKVPILNGKIRHALLLELFTDRGIGTEVTL